jgi:hypothetical protein
LITVKPENADAQTIDVMLKIADKIIADRGDNEPWRHSRLRWLNSTLGIDDKPTRPYEAIQPLGERAYRITDKKISVGENRMPGMIEVRETEVLAHPLSFIVETPNGIEQFSPPESITVLKNEPGIISKSWESHSPDIELSGTGSLVKGKEAVISGCVNTLLMTICHNGTSISLIKVPMLQ